MLPIIPLHVLFAYGAKRFNGIMEFGQNVANEMQTRANKLPPNQRAAAMKFMIADRKSIEREVLVRLKQEKEFSDAFSRALWIAFWFIALPLGYWFFSTR